MQELQREITDEKEEKSVAAGVEVVRAGISDLPVLADWTAAEGPIMMGDWLTLLEPAMADMSSTSEEWWTLMMASVQTWYNQRMLLSAVERASHTPVAPPELQQRRWQRLERRVASLLLKAIPDAQKEVVAGKNLSTFSIMAWPIFRSSISQVVWGRKRRF